MQIFSTIFSFSEFLFFYLKILPTNPKTAPNGAKKKIMNSKFFPVFCPRHQALGKILS